MSGPRSPWERPSGDGASGGDGADGSSGGDYGQRQPDQYPALGYPQQDPYQQGSGGQYAADPRYPGGQYPAGGYTGPQYPGAPPYPGGPAGPEYPGGPQYPAGPGGGGRSRTGLYIAAGVATVLVVVMIAGAIIWSTAGSGKKTTPIAGGGSTTSAAPSTSAGGGGGACGYPGSGISAAITTRVTSGPLSFPISAAPDWTPQTYTTYAQSRAAAGLVKALPGQPWQAGAEIGQTTWSPAISSADAATRMVDCIAAGAGYNSANPKVTGKTQPEAVKVDGVDAHKVTADIHVQKDLVTVEGDHLTVIVIESAPQTYVLTDTPIGDASLAGEAQKIIDSLKVAKDV
ncbi:hypothetical protein P0W64_19165 [Tsukamurella sp. 8F]|uniref:hypothetical protein n=1 Tax=unclassified Tsukamurella TaxID=2633480 RepID=UPI0023B8CBB5|nr:MULTISPECIES: hypothetical protein [unclassified Tsukamurella]MDF0532502.1 hypothetical protein [Tsukamurella sp. 8J]MDF0588906.1 hypothetical protein [Tsukamurella sp. 8F]